MVANKKQRTIMPDRLLEQSLYNQGFELVAGLDEVGRGAWAGPLVMAAVILKIDTDFLGLRDSKLLSAATREKLAPQVQDQAVAWALGIVTVEELNQFGLGQGLHLAGKRAIDGLRSAPDFVLFDGKYPLRGLSYPQQTVIKGDQTVRVIAAASVVAKVARDAMMRELHQTDQTIEKFRFDLNKGYPSTRHRQWLQVLGPSLHHRRTFAPIQTLLNRKLFNDI